jgi:hypothetical protein
VVQTAQRKRKRALNARRGPRKSAITRQQFYLTPHDEEKVLLFTTGIVFGVGLAATLLGKSIFGGVVALVVALVLIFVEINQRYHD